MDDATSFGQWLRAQRRLHDLTREALASQVGCAVVTIKKIETDERRPSRQIAERLLAVLSVPTQDQLAIIRLARATPVLDRPTIATPPRVVGTLSDDDLTGRSFKGYELRERIGSGGFGAVYRALQTGVGREVAVKAILARYADHPDFIRRFEAEAQIVARLEHPHIVPLYDYWREPGGAYLVMRYVRGGSLQMTLGKVPWLPEQVARLLDQVGAALHFAHQRGVVHRDVKPANILLDTDGNAYLADFGIAKDLWSAAPDDLTRTGAIVGSPAYLSPEQIKDEPITPQTDIYSLGIVLYELLTSSHPFTNLTPAERLWKQLNEPLPALGGTRPDLPSAYDAVIQRATAKRPSDRYSDVVHLLTDWHRVSEAAAPAASHEPLATTLSIITPLLPDKLMVMAEVADAATATDLAQIENPYKGLRAFSEADAADFFGRAALIGRLLERLAEERADARFLAVVGPSGSGKSSVVRAGLVPALYRGALPNSEKWFVVEITPGAHPLEELEAGLLRIAVNPPPSLLEQLQADQHGLLRAIKRVLPADDDVELVLVIDQFEELFTLVEDETVREHVLHSLFAAMTDSRSRLRMIITLRADFYDRPLLYPGFGELIRERTEVVLPLTENELEQVIVGPATRVGVSVESTLVAVIKHDTGVQVGTLPLVQFALTELFKQRKGLVLTLDEYKKSGGVRNALAQRAETIFKGLDARGQAAARQLFLRLITPGEGVEDTRRRVRRAELINDPGITDTVIERYGHDRLLTFDRDPITRGSTVEVAHEALMHSWERLRSWLETSRDDLLIQRRLQAASAEWLQSGQDASFLARGTRLAQFEALATDTDLALNEEESTYLRASIAEGKRQEVADRERLEREVVMAQQTADAAKEAAVSAEQTGNLQRIAARRLRALGAALATLLIVALTLTAFALNSRSEAIKRQQEAINSSLTATVAEGQAINNAATATVAQGQALNNAVTAIAQRLAAEANGLLQTSGNVEEIALLSIRSMQTRYTTQGDAVLTSAAQLIYPQRILAGHMNGVWRVTFSPDGKYLLTASWDNTARLWDAQTGVQLHAFTDHIAEVVAVAFSPDGKRALTGSFDKTARLWDVQTGAALRVFSGHTDRLTSATFSPDGKEILTGSADKTARLWDAESGSEIREFTVPTGSVRDVQFSPDGKYILTGDEDKTIRLWEIQSGTEIRTFIGHTDAINRVAFSPDGSTILSCSEDKTVRLWDVQSGTEIRRFIGHIDTIRDIAFSPDGNAVLTGSQDKTARLWNTQTGTELQVFADHPDFVFAVAFSPDGRTIATGSLDTSARLWSTQMTTLPPQFTGHALAYSPDGLYVLTDGDNQTAQLWEAHTGERLRTFSGHIAPVTAVAFSGDGKYVVTGSVDKTVRVWDVKTGDTRLTISGANDVIFAIAFSPDNKYILTSSSGDSTAYLWDAQTGKQLRMFSGHQGPVFRVTFSPDGKYVLTSSADQTAKLWDTQTGKEIQTFTGHNAPVSSVAFSHDGKYVLTGSFDKTVRLWDIQTGTVLRTFTGHTAEIGDATFSSDGKNILTGSFDKTARLWNTQTGEQIRVFSHPDRVIAVAFAPDGQAVLTSNADGIVRQWYVDYQETIHTLCSRLLRDFTSDERVQYNIADEKPTCQ